MDYYDYYGEEEELTPEQLAEEAFDEFFDLWLTDMDDATYEALIDAAMLE